MERTKKPTKESFTAPANSLTTKTPYKGPGADSEEKHEPVSDIDTVVADSLKVLDLKRPIREADMLCPTNLGRFGPTPEVGKAYSIASLARTSSVLGMSRFSAFAVFKLTSISKRDGRSVGRWAGLVPFSTFPAMTPTSR